MIWYYLTYFYGFAQSRHFFYMKITAFVILKHLKFAERLKQLLFQFYA